jgi:peptidoglycan/LPS O-acetylase OafA/YrhL
MREQRVLDFRNGARAYWLQQHLWSRKLDLSLISYGCFFAVGGLTYVIAREGRSLIRLLAMILFNAAGLIEVNYKTVHANTIFNANQSALVPQLVYVFAVACVFASMRSEASGSNHAARFIRMLGLATYPLYLFHQIVGAAIMKSVLIAGGSKYVALGSAFLSCLAASILIANFLEPPVRALVRRLLFWITDLFKVVGGRRAAS